jgi:hypothetical protein
MGIPQDISWLFWDVDVAALDMERDANYVLARVLERGRLSDVNWAIQTYGLERIHGFFRDAGHPELSRRTLVFWQYFFEDTGESWKTPVIWRKDSSLP